MCDDRERKQKRDREEKDREINRKQDSKKMKKKVEKRMRAYEKAKSGYEKLDIMGGILC